MKSLIVDDDFTCAAIFRTQLSKYGECDIVSNGIDAIEAYKISIIRGNPYNLFVIDIMMPEMNGYEVLQNIRTVEFEKQISPQYYAKIIMATGLDDDQNRQLAKSLNPELEAYFAKSNNIEDFLNKVQRLCF